MDRYKDGDSYSTDTRVVEQFWKFESAAGSMGSWSYDEALLEEHTKLIAKYVFQWSNGDGYHPHDIQDNCTSFKSISEAHEAGDLTYMLEQLSYSVCNFNISRENIWLEKVDPLVRTECPHHSVVKATINGHTGYSVHDFSGALWHALLNMSIAEKAKRNSEPK